MAEKAKAKKLTEFGQYLDDEGIPFPVAAKALGKTSSYVGMLARGQASPQLVLSARIHVFSKGRVPWTAWLPADVRRQVERTRAARS